MSLNWSHINLKFSCTWGQLTCAKKPFLACPYNIIVIFIKGNILVIQHSGLEEHPLFREEMKNSAERARRAETLPDRISDTAWLNEQITPGINSSLRKFN